MNIAHDLFFYKNKEATQKEIKNYNLKHNYRDTLRFTQREKDE